MSRRKYLEKYPHMISRPWPRNYLTVYVLRSENRQLLFVGRSADVTATLKLHDSLDIWFDAVKHIEIHRCQSAKDADAVSAKILKNETPLLSSRIDELG